MGTLKDLVDLVTQLDSSIKDRKTRDLFLPVKELALEIQKSQFELEQRHQREMTELQSRHDKEIANLRALQNEPKSGDKCPFCNQHTGKLKARRPHDIFGTAIYVHDYQCANCDKEYDRESET